MFDSVLGSMFVLSLAGTMCDDITGVTVVFIEEGHYWMFAAFLAFVVLSSFTALNMLLGIVCEVIVEVKEMEEEKRLLEDVREKIVDTFEALDEDGSGMISKKEFIKLTENEDVMEALALMEVKPDHLLSLSDSLFDKDNDEAGEVELEFADFLRVLVHLRPGQDASVMDVAETRKTMRRAIKKTEAKLDEVRQTIMTMPAPTEHLSALKTRIQKLPAVIRMARSRTLAAEAQVQVLQAKLASRRK
jgi:hypothetical protein